MLLGAKYAPCMRADQQLLRAFEQERVAESRTGCCVYNTGSGCYQSTQEVCQGVGWHGVQQSETTTFTPTPPPLTYPTSSHLPHLLSPTPPPLTYPTSSHLSHLLSPTPPPLTYPTSSHLPHLLSPTPPPLTYPTSSHLPHLLLPTPSLSPPSLLTQRHSQRLSTTTPQ